jgi:predicted MPP superfamily phosphohydrolase
MVVVFILIVCAYLGSNFYVFIRGLEALQSFPLAVKWIFGGCFWISVFSVAVIMLLRNSRITATTWAHLVFEYSTGWLVFVLYMTLFLACFEVFRLFNHPCPYNFILSLGLTACLLSYGFYHYRHPLTKVINLTIDKPVNGAGGSFKIVAVSDLHLGMGTSQHMLQKYIRMIMEQQPDLILIGGDLIDNSVTAVQNRHMETDLAQLSAPSGIYMAPGNHEYISGLSECIQFIGHTPVILLQDSVVTLPNGVQLIGRDDRSNHDRKPLSQLIALTDPQKPVLVLDHQPYELSQAGDAGADLLFCGHTHRGQVWPMNLLTDRLFELSYGYAKRGKTHIYVSSGLALWGPPFRIGSHSEMVVFNLSSTPAPRP